MQYMPIDFWDPLGCKEEENRIDKPSYDLHNSLAWILSKGQILCEDSTETECVESYTRCFRNLILLGLERRFMVNGSFESVNYDIKVNVKHQQNIVIQVCLDVRKKGHDQVEYYYHSIADCAWNFRLIHDAIDLNRILELLPATKTGSPFGPYDIVMPPTIHPRDCFEQGLIMTTATPTRTVKLTLGDQTTEAYKEAMIRLASTKNLVQIQILLNDLSFIGMTKEELIQFCSKDLIVQIHKVKKK